MDNEAYAKELLKAQAAGRTSYFADLIAPPVHFTAPSFYPAPQPVTIKVYSKWESRWIRFKYWWNDTIDRLKL